MGLLVALPSQAQNSCKSAIRTPKVYTDAKAFNKNNPELYQRFVTTFVETGFFLGPKMLSVFERQLINDGALSYDVEENTFVSTKELTEKNKATLEQMMKAPRKDLVALSGRILDALVECMALNHKPGSDRVLHEIKEEMAFSERPWDPREIKMEDVTANQKVLFDLLATKSGKALLQDMIIETIPLYAHMLERMLIYTNDSLDVATALAGKIGWSVALTAAVGVVDVLSISEFATAAAGAIVETPGMTATVRFFRMRQIEHLQQEVSWTLAANMRNQVQ